MKTKMQAHTKNALSLSSATPASTGLLQRKCACGNHTMAGGECAACGKKKRSGLQTKLTINEPGDIYEQEADRIADQVMATPASTGVSGAPPRIQRFSGQSSGHMDTAPASVDQALASPGRPLEPTLRQDMEQRFGYDFSRVRVHSGGAAEQSARDVNAHAYTVGHDIVFDAGRFAPGTHEGRRLIAHELTHVVQQSGSERNRAGQSDERRGRSPIPVAIPVGAMPIVSAPTPPVLQRKYAGIGSGGSAREHTNSASVRQAFSMPPIVTHALQSSAQPLDPTTRARLEPTFGFDFGSVRIHADSTADRSARALGALAYTVGRDIVFASGRFNPHTQAGLGVLAHELAHVVQQRGNTGAPERFSMGADKQSPAEQEAERARHAIESGQPLPALTARISVGVQRLPGSPAGGCGLCYGQPNNVGLAAHPLIEAAFINEYPFLDITGEFPFPVIASPGDENGKLDLAQFEGFQNVKIGEIKPFNENGLADGQDDLRWYKTQLEIFGFRVKLLDLQPPADPIPFPTLAPKSCPQIPLTHDLFVTPLAHGLYGYWCIPDYAEFVKTCDCRTGERRKKETEPPVVGDRPFKSKGDPKSTAEPKGKGNGQPGKGNGQPGKGNGQPGKGDGKQERPGKRLPPEQQPTLRLPSWLLLAIGIVASLAIIGTIWGKIGAVLGTILRALGFTLGILGGTAAAAGTSPGGGGSPTGPPKGDPVAVPGKDIIVPGGAPPGTTVPPTQTPPSVTTPPQGGVTPTPPKITVPKPDETPPTSGAPTKSSTTASKARGTPSRAAGVASKAAGKGRTIDLALIEGLNLQSVSKGRFFFIRFAQGQQIDAFLLFQAVEKRTQGEETTVEFKAMMECDLTQGCIWTGNTYRVTHPYRPTGSPALVAYADPNRRYPEWVMGHLERTAEQLDEQGRTTEARQVREELRRVKQLAKSRND